MSVHEIMNIDAQAKMLRDGLEHISARMAHNRSNSAGQITGPEIVDTIDVLTSIMIKIVDEIAQLKKKHVSP